MTMSSETDEVKAAAEELVHTMARLVRAIDAVGDDGEAAKHVPQDVPAAMEELAGRVNAAQGFSS
jgi:hypothetical protein